MFRWCKSLRFLHSSPNPVKPGRTVWHLITVVADLKLAIAIGGANYESGFTFFVGRPLIAPQTPAQPRSGFGNLSVIPSFTVVAANLDFRNAAVATESHPA
jgi:hypothetical protein